MPKGVYTRTKPGYWAGKKRPDISKRNSKLTGREALRWLGENASYEAKHQWLRRIYGKATHCENKKCTSKNPKRFEWANISKKYFRRRNDWKQLCASCHRKYDFTEEQRANIQQAHKNCLCLKHVGAHKRRNDGIYGLEEMLRHSNVITEDDFGYQNRFRKCEQCGRGYLVNLKKPLNRSRFCTRECAYRKP